MFAVDSVTGHQLRYAAVPKRGGSLWVTLFVPISGRNKAVCVAPMAALVESLHTGVKVERGVELPLGAHFPRWLRANPVTTAAAALERGAFDSTLVSVQNDEMVLSNKASWRR